MQELLMSSFGANMLISIPAGIIFLVFPIVALICCWISKSSVPVKGVWSVIIIITWPLFALGALVYGITNFKSLGGRIFSILSMGIILLSAYLTFTMNPKELDKFGDLISSKITESTRKEIITSSLSDEIKKELQANLDTLEKEKKELQLTDDQKHVYVLLPNYMALSFEGGMDDKELEQWRAVFAKRQTISSEYLTKLIQYNVTDKTITKTQEK